MARGNLSGEEWKMIELLLPFKRVGSVWRVAIRL